MKRILTTTFLAIVVATSFSQTTSLNYNDLGVLLSRDDNYGTSRFNAMSGAFGALGGDLSSISINPAGGAVSINSKAAVTLGVNSINSNTNYYNNTNNGFKNENFNLSQAGGLFVYENNKSKSKWNRFALGFNYQTKADFDDTFSASGNGDFVYFTANPNENNNNPYNTGINQHYNRTTSGSSSKFALGFSGAYDNKLFVGTTLNFHNIDFKELVKLEENSEDINRNKMNAFNVQEASYQGNGFSLGLGFIYKMDNFRFGLAYETPTIYQEIIEESNLIKQDPNNFDFIGYTEIKTTDPDGASNPINYKTENKFDSYTYRFQTPSKVTASGAYVFGKKGLISADYTFKNYTSTKFLESDAVFTEVNQSFTQHYRDTHTLNIGTEWRFDRLSIRGGYHYEKNPNLLLGGSVNTDNARGFSLGAGYNFGNMIIDLGYYKTEKTDFYHLYQLNDMSVDNNISRVTGTLTINL